ncbi:DUF6611 family protein [Agromyces sp. Root81]|uniref:DUF6611 family protein n=1 Tax=Agromyces sp. Root81 TaxID=1736601 RepID=UPI0026B83FA2
MNEFSTTASGVVATPSEAIDLAMRLEDDARHRRHRTPTWGRLEIDSPPRWGWSAYRLRVFPPQIDAADRRLLWFDDWAPLLGAVGGVLLFAAGAWFLDPAWLLAFLPAGIGLTTLAARRLSADVRASVRSIEVCCAPGSGMYGDGAALVQRFEELTEMDRMLRSRQIDEAEYRRRWLAVYETVPRGRHRPARAAR